MSAEKTVKRSIEVSIAGSSAGRLVSRLFPLLAPGKTIDGIWGIRDA